MHRVRIALVGLLALASSACVTSVQPYVAEPSARFTPELVGTWADSAGKERAVITAAGARAYGVVYTEEGGKARSFTARLGTVGARQVLDLTDLEATPDSDGTHLALFVTANGGRMSVALLEPDSLRNYLTAHPRAVAHRRTKDTLVLTASTAELSRFLGSYLQRPGVLSKPSVWRRRDE